MRPWSRWGAHGRLGLPLTVVLCVGLAGLLLAAAACTGPGSSRPAGPSDGAVAETLERQAPIRPLADRPAVVACVDDQPWPPFTYRDRQGHLTGASVALLREALRRAGRRLVLTDVPWMRCLHRLRTGNADLTLDTSYTEDRARTYRFGPALYRIRSGLYYVKTRFPGGLDVQTPKALAALQYCGMQGYNYDAYPIPRSRIDTGARGPLEAFAKLRVGRCQAVIGYPIPHGELARLGVLDLKGIATHPLPGHLPLAYSLMLSRKGPAGGDLARVLREQFEAMGRDGSHARILGAHGVRVPESMPGGTP